MVPAVEVVVMCVFPRWIDCQEYHMNLPSLAVSIIDLCQ